MSKDLTAKRKIIPVLAALLVAGCQSPPSPTVTPVPTPTPTLTPQPTAYGGGSGLIAFIGREVAGTDFHIYTMTSDGSNITRLTDSGGGYADLAWSPDGSQIAFASGSHMGSHILVMDVQTREVRDVGSGSAPQWSPDGQVIATQVQTDLQQSQLWLIDLNGGAPVMLAERLDSDYIPDWSPDGKQLAFIAEAGSDATAAFIINRDGSRLHPVSSTGKYWSVEWSPDGERIAFNSSFSQDARRGDLYVVGADGYGLNPLTSTPDVQEFEAAWSPDGEWLAFYTIDDAGMESEASSIYVIRAVGGDTALVTTIPGVAGHLTWSPDGTVLAFRQVHIENGAFRTRLYTVLRDGTHLRQISPETLDSFYSSWLP